MFICKCEVGKMNVDVPLDILEGFNSILTKDSNFEFFLIAFKEMTDSKLFSFQCNFAQGNSRTISFREIIFNNIRIMEVLDGKSCVVVELPLLNSGFITMVTLEKISANLNNIKDIDIFSNLMNNLMQDLSFKESFSLVPVLDKLPIKTIKPLTFVEKIFRLFLRFLT